MELTQEHKDKMAEGRRRAAAQKKAEAEAAQAEKEAEADARAEAKLTEAPRHTAPAMQQAVQPDPEPIQYGGQQEWGPFDSFMEITTQYGLYGLEAWTVMHFEEYETVLPDGKPITSHRPVYRKVARIR